MNAPPDPRMHPTPRDEARSACDVAPVVHLLIVGDVLLYCEGLAHLLRHEDRPDLVETATSCDEALAHVREREPDLVLIDMAMPDSVATVRAIAETAPRAALVALAVRDNDTDVVACAEVGIAGYVFRSGTLDELRATLDCTARGELRCTPHVAAVLRQRLATLAALRPAATPQVTLTSRECEIVGLIDEGFSNKEIARRLCIEVPTVKNHVHHILEKLSVKRRGEAAARVRTAVRPPPPQRGVAHASPTGLR
jgi:two-component system, NarL family, nitrate/nitrite response regulator NarL